MLKARLVVRTGRRTAEESLAEAKRLRDEIYRLAALNPEVVNAFGMAVMEADDSIRSQLEAQRSRPN